MTSMTIAGGPAIVNPGDAALLPAIAARARGRRGRRRTAIPGFGLTLGITIFWLSLIVLIPLGALFLKAASSGWSDFVAGAFSDRALAAYKISFGTAFIAAAVNAVFGLLVAYVLVRY